MSDSPSGEKWPEYHPGNRKDILAFGVIALNYGLLENMYRALFSCVTGMNEFQTAAIFHRLPNNQRKDVLYDLLAKTTVPRELRDIIRYFAVGFGVCADNRHDIMHSSSGGRHSGIGGSESGIVLAKYTNAGDKLECYPTVAILRSVADEIHAYAIFGMKVTGAVRDYQYFLNYEEPEKFRPEALPEKPPPPTPLNWRSPAVPKGSESPPQSSGA